MTAIFHIVLPMFTLIGLGIYAGRYRGFGNAMVQGLSRYLGLYALPALLFSNMAKAVIPDPLQWGFLASFYLAAFAVFSLSAAIMWMGRQREAAAAIGLGSSFSNIALLGVPIILEAYGSAVAVPVMLLVVFQSPVLFTIATLLAEGQRGGGGKPLKAALTAVRATILSPLVMAVLLGVVFNLLKIPLPDMAWKSLGLLAQTVLPCACFTLGATLCAGPARGSLIPAAMMALFKTLLHPALTWVLAVKVFHLPADWLAAAVTAAALPIGMNAYVFAERYAGRDIVSASLLLSTLFAPVSISLAFMVAHW